MRRDPYEVLGLDPNASQEEIERSYRNAVKRWHPDTGPENEAAHRTKLTQELTEAMREIRAHPRTFSAAAPPARPWYWTEDEVAAAASAAQVAPATAARASGPVSPARGWDQAPPSPLERVLSWLIRVGMWLVALVVTWWVAWWVISLVLWLIGLLLGAIT